MVGNMVEEALWSDGGFFLGGRVRPCGGLTALEEETHGRMPSERPRLWPYLSKALLTSICFVHGYRRLGYSF